MTEPRDLIFELGTEELPPGAVRPMAEALAAALAEELSEAGLEHGRVDSMATPRRLAVLVEKLAPSQPDQPIERRGPALAAAFDAEGRPTRAAEGFAHSCGVSVAELGTLETEKGAWLAYRTVQPGQSAQRLLPDLIGRALERLPVPRRMRWGNGDVAFSRPVHWALLRYGDEVIPARFYGVESGGVTYGHRFHAPHPLELSEPAAYAAELKKHGWVIAHISEREKAIRAQVLAAAREMGGEVVIEPDLLEEVAALVEWPVAVAGSFDEEFLEVPAEAIVAAMQGHQRYFPVRGPDGGILPCFVAVANIESRNPETVRHGNERVLRPRLADARFFWNSDRKRPLAERLPQLADMVFQERLGSLRDKSERIAALGGEIATIIGAERDAVIRAGWLAKCDLLTEMVGEFPELQGTMGRYYARLDGEPAQVAAAIEEHYLPRQSGGALPETPEGRALALADRLDTLAGIFGVGLEPSGDKDPFALRRAGLGILRICIEGELSLDLRRSLEAATKQLPEAAVPANLVQRVLDFLLDRLRGYLLEAGYRPDEFDAVAALGPSDPLDVRRRLDAVRAFRQLPEGDALSAANKRIRNIIRRADQADLEGPDQPVQAEPAEEALAEAVAAARSQTRDALDAGDYQVVLERLAVLREPVDRFFDDVMVMADDPELRRARLRLLRETADLFMAVADISRLQS